MTIRVVVADDQGMVRSGFSILLNAQPDIEVVGEAVNGQEAVARVAELSPDVILMDVRMPVLDGLQATRQIMAAGDGVPRVLVLTTFDLDDYVYEALRAGASGFLLKDASAGELATAVRVVAAGDALLAPGVTRRLIAEFARLGAPRAASRKNLEDLTERETEVLALVARGMSNFVGLRPWHRRWYPVVNGWAAVVGLGVAAASGLSAGDLGLGRERLRDGVRLGSLVAAPVVGAFGLAAVVPDGRRLLDDQLAGAVARGGCRRRSVPGSEVTVSFPAVAVPRRAARSGSRASPPAGDLGP